MEKRYGYRLPHYIIHYVNLLKHANSQIDPNVVQGSLEVSS